MQELFNMQSKNVEIIFLLILLLKRCKPSLHTYLCADGTHIDTVYHPVRMAVVPVLVHELFLREREGVQAVPGRLVVAVVC